MTTIRVEDFGDDIEQSVLRTYFGIFGKITRCNIITWKMDNYGKSRRHLIIDFEDESAATRAVRLMNGKQILGATKLQVQLVKPKETETYGAGETVDCDTASMVAKNSVKNKNEKEAVEKLDVPDSKLGVKPGNTKSKEIQSKFFDGAFGLLSETKQKDILKRLLLPQIELLHPDNADKMMSIFIRLEIEELMKMFEDSTLLKAKCTGILNARTCAVTISCPPISIEM